MKDLSKGYSESKVSPRKYPLNLSLISIPQSLCLLLSSLHNDPRPRLWTSVSEDQRVDELISFPTRWEPFGQDSMRITGSGREETHVNMHVYKNIYSGKIELHKATPVVVVPFPEV